MLRLECYLSPSPSPSPLFPFFYARMGWSDRRERQELVKVPLFFSFFFLLSAAEGRGLYSGIDRCGGQMKAGNWSARRTPSLPLFLSSLFSLFSLFFPKPLRCVLIEEVRRGCRSSSDAASSFCFISFFSSLSPIERGGMPWKRS